MKTVEEISLECTYRVDLLGAAVAVQMLNKSVKITESGVQTNYGHYHQHTPGAACWGICNEIWWGREKIACMMSSFVNIGQHQKD